LQAFVDQAENKTCIFLELMQKLLLLTHSLLFLAFRWFFCEFQYLLVVVGGWGFVQHSYCLSLLADYLKPGMSVLDVGSGSGYLTAVLGLMVCLHTSQTKHFFTPPFSALLPFYKTKSAEKISLGHKLQQPFYKTTFRRNVWT
jgi:uncharacterized protein (DUF486 family)